MRICILTSQIFAWGKYGGFGQIARSLARQIAARGHPVTVLMPRRAGQPRRRRLENFEVIGYGVWDLLSAGPLFKDVEAHVFHSIEPHYLTALAQRAAPAAAHVVTCLDVRMAEERALEVRFWPLGRRLMAPVHSWFEYGRAVRRAVQHADVVVYQAPDQLAKIRAVFQRRHVDGWLPNPIAIPARPGPKSAEPLVAWVARLDPRKQPELFLDLVRAAPGVRFLAFGTTADSRLRSLFARAAEQLPNLQWFGFVNQFESDQLFRELSRCWVLVNTAAREGLPVSFLEAWAHGCAVLSCNDACGLVRRFGYLVEDGDFLRGLRWLLSGDRWHRLGQAGREWVAEHYEAGHIVERHIRLYELAASRARRRRGDE